MPVIRAGSLPSGNLRGADHRATLSVLLDHRRLAAREKGWAG